MDHKALGALISRLEKAAAASPLRYRVSAVAVAALGFCILGIALGFAVLPVAALIALFWLVALKGTLALLLLVKLGKAVLLLAIPAWTMIRSSMSLLLSRLQPPKGRELTRAEAPRLFERLAELRHRMRGPAVHKVLLIDALNAAIVQYPRFGLFGWEQNFLILGLPLLQSLSEPEALAVVAHEYGHLSGYHGRLGGFVYRLRSAWAQLQAMSESWTDWGSRLIARMFRWYAPYFNAYTFVLARQNEYQADQTSVEMVGPENAANALMRIHITAQFADATFWPSFNRRVIHEGEPPGDRSAYWEESLRTGLDSQQRVHFLEVARKDQTDHFNTHPALNDRLLAMKVEVGADAALALQPPAVTAASAWLGPNLKTIAAEFDSKWREGIAEHWRSRHGQLQKSNERLGEIESHPSPTQEELWERIELLPDVRPDADPMDAVAEFLNRFPDHPGARLRRGAHLLLQKGDEAGIADVEFAMARDKAAVMAGCQVASTFYASRDPDKAKQYARRAKEHTEWQARVKAEASTLPADAELAPAELSPQDLQAVAAILRAQGAQVREAYVLRRIVKSDRSVIQHVLAVETEKAVSVKQAPEVIKRLSQQTFPGDIFVVHLGTPPFKRFWESIRRMGVQPLAFR